MSFRIENKYKLEKAKLYKFFEFLKKNNAKVLYPKRSIYSIYFDNLKFSSYKDSIEGLVPRKKIRIRTYPENLKQIYKSKFNLEIKISSVEGKFKSSFKNINSSKIIKEGYYDQNYGLCFPVVEVFYKREYFSLFDLRLTLDSSIKYLKFKDKIKNNIININEEMILEAKSNNTNMINQIENEVFFQKTRFSKYCNAVEKTLDYPKPFN